jgi:hypothetical protein
MSWKSETRRKVEDLLDRLANGEDGHANIAGRAGRAERPSLFDRSRVREMSTIFADGLSLSEDYGMELLHAVKREMFGSTMWSPRVAPIGVRATPDESKAATMWRVIAAREIERGLLG